MTLKQVNNINRTLFIQFWISHWHKLVFALKENNKELVNLKRLIFTGRSQTLASPYWPAIPPLIRQGLGLRFSYARTHSLVSHDISFVRRPLSPILNDPFFIFLVSLLPSLSHILEIMVILHSAPPLVMFMVHPSSCDLHPSFALLIVHPSSFIHQSLLLSGRIWQILLMLESRLLSQHKHCYCHCHVWY